MVVLKLPSLPRLHSLVVHAIFYFDVIIYLIFSETSIHRTSTLALPYLLVPWLPALSLLQRCGCFFLEQEIKQSPNKNSVVLLSLSAPTLPQPLFSFSLLPTLPLK
jgi:hypothetical protein